MMFGFDRRHYCVNEFGVLLVERGEKLHILRVDLDRFRRGELFRQAVFGAPVVPVIQPGEEDRDDDDKKEESFHKNQLTCESASFLPSAIISRKY